MPLFRSLPEPQKKAINEISQLIKELKEKRKEWKRFQPNHITGYNPGKKLQTRNWAVDYHWDGPSRDLKTRIRNEFDNLANKVKDVCIYSCSYFIAELKQSRRIISKVPEPYKTRELKKTALNLEKYYNDILTSDLKKKLQEEHRLEFKEALADRKWMIEGYKDMANLDIEKLMSDGWVPRKELNKPHIRELIQNVGKRNLQDRYPIGWRDRTWRKNLLRKYNVFHVFVGNNIKQFRQIISSPAAAMPP
jgi:hypothetical protein